MASGLENPEVFHKSTLLGLHAMLEQKLAGEMARLCVPIPSFHPYLCVWLQGGTAINDHRCLNPPALESWISCLPVGYPFAFSLLRGPASQMSLHGTRNNSS